MHNNELQQSLSEAFSRQDSRSVQRLLRSIFRAEPSLSNAQLVLKHSQQAGFFLPKEAFKVGFLRAFTVEPLLPIIKAAAIVGGINLQVEIGNFNTYNQEILDRESWLYKYRPHAVIFAFQCRDLLPEIWHRAAELNQSEMSALVQSALDDIRMKVSTIRAHLSSAILLPTLDTPLYPATGILDSQLEYGQQAAIEAFNQGLHVITRNSAGVYVVDVRELGSRFGKDRWYDQRNWNMARLPFSADAIPKLAMEYMKFLHVLSGRVSKVIAVDLDNTLWGGVIGEDGIEGIQVGPSSRGEAFQSLQRALLDCYNRGILLAICSKNNPQDAMEVIEKHPEMLLRPEHFAALRINWEDKAKNLRDIADELNLGVDSIAFLDDNAVERERVATEVPEVQVLELPSDPLLYGNVVRECPFFQRLSLSNEDKDRGRYYAEERQRRDIQGSATSMEDFYRSLAMEAEVAEADDKSLTRVAQLTQKTNQFNLTTRRYTEQQVLAFTRDPKYRVYYLKSRDRFGDNGIVGVAISILHEHTCEIDTFLMSCRVIGRTLEKAMLSQIAHDASAAGVRHLDGWYIPTAKNAPAKDFYFANGFTAVEQKQDGSILWRCDLEKQNLEWPEWIVKLSRELQKA